MKYVVRKIVKKELHKRLDYEKEKMRLEILGNWKSKVRKSLLEENTVNPFYYSGNYGKFYPYAGYSNTFKPLYFKND